MSYMPLPGLVGPVAPDFLFSRLLKKLASIPSLVFAPPAVFASICKYDEKTKWMNDKSIFSDQLSHLL